MNAQYIAYCGLYCENCAVKVKIEPAAKTLYEEMKKAGFEEIVQLIPGGDTFWPFLQGMVDPGVCVSCKSVARVISHSNGYTGDVSPPHTVIIARC